MIGTGTDGGDVVVGRGRQRNEAGTAGDLAPWILVVLLAIALAISLLTR